MSQGSWGERKDNSRGGRWEGKARGSNCGGEICKSGNAADNGLSGCLLSKVLIFERGSFLNEPGVEALSLLSSCQ